jgi:hypothetical protein
VHGFGEAVQQEDQRCAGCAGDEGIEGQTGSNRDLFELAMLASTILVEPNLWCGRWESNPHDVAIEGF